MSRGELWWVSSGNKEIHLSEPESLPPAAHLVLPNYSCNQVQKSNRYCFPCLALHFREHLACCKTPCTLCHGMHGFTQKKLSPLFSQNALCSLWSEEYQLPEKYL